MDADSFFQPIWEGYSTQLGASSVLPAVLSATAGALIVVMGFYVIVTGILIVRGSMSWADGTSRMIKAVLIAAVLTPAWWNEYVVAMFVHRIPDEIATVVGGSKSQSTVVEVFDQLLATVEAMMAQINANAGWSVSSIGKVFGAYMASALAELALLIAFGIWFLSAAVVGIIVSIGPFLMPFWLFDFTKHIPVRMVGLLLSKMVLAALILITTQVVQAQERTYVKAYAASMPKRPPNAPPMLSQRTDFFMADGMFVPQMPQSFNPPVEPDNGNLDRQVALLWKVALTFVFGAALLALMPGIAAHLAGGVAARMSPVIINAGRNLIGGR